MADRKWAAGDKLHIGLLWHSDRSKNLGVGALTIGNLTVAREVGAELGIELRFTLFTTMDRGQPYIRDPRVDVMRFRTLNLLTPWGFWRWLCGVDLMLDIGGGDSFADIYPFKRFRMIFWTKVLTVMRGVPLILSPQTIGPFEKPGYTAAARWVLRKARAVVVRDDLSAAAVRKLSPKVTPIDAVDVAFALPWSKIELPASGKTRVGVNVSGLLYRGGYSGRGEFDLGYDYRLFTDRLLAALAVRTDVEVHLICHVVETGGVDNDSSAADELAALYPTFVRAPDFASPSAAKSYIAALDLLIGARMHATIAAFSSGVPVLPVSYSRKFEGLFGTLGYTWLIPHKGMSTDEALDFALEVLDRRHEMKADIGEGMKRVEARLDAYRAVLREAFKAAISERRLNPVPSNSPTV